MDEKYYWYLHGSKFEISRKTYDENRSEENHQNYIKRLEKTHGLCSYHNLDINGMTGEEIIADTSVNIEEQVLKNIMLEKQRECFKLLTEDEAFIIKQIYFENKTDRELEKITGIPKSTINDRKQRILKKLKELIENKKI